MHFFFKGGVNLIMCSPLDIISVLSNYTQDSDKATTSKKAQDHTNTLVTIYNPSNLNCSDVLFSFHMKIKSLNLKFVQNMENSLLVRAISSTNL